MRFPPCETETAVHVCLDCVVAVLESSPKCRAIYMEEEE